MLVDEAFRFAEECLGGDCSGHGTNHIRRVVKNARKILAFEKEANEEVVLLSAILHDVDDYKLGGDGKNLERFFRENEIDEELRKKIRNVIENISFSKSGDRPCFETLEEKIVSDADKLDAMGAVGVCRTVMYSTVVKRELFIEEELPVVNLSKEEYMNKNRKGNHSINHFFDKLLKLRNAMQTEAGRKMAEKRHLFMVEFLKEFFDEVDARDEWWNVLKEYETV